MKKKERKNIFIIGSKGMGNYGGYETFVEKLTEYHMNNKNLKYHIAWKAKDNKEFEKNNARCFNIKVPNIGPAQAIYYDIAALSNCCKYIKKNNIEKPIIYILACRIGPFMKHYVRKVHKLGGKVYVNPDGHEWLRAKWSAPVRKYWKISEKLMVKYADLLICDSINIEKYIKETYKKYNPNTTYIAYGAETKRSVLKDTDKKVIDWYKEKKLKPKNYYLVVGRFVPENNYETMIKEFMKSKTKKDFAIITNVNDKFLNELEEKLHFRKDTRIKFVGTVYDKDLLMKIRENAYGYFHGHEVGGTNPSLLEALGSTDLNLLLDVGFNREVAEDTALYWNKQEGNLANLINKCDQMGCSEKKELSKKSTEIIKKKYSWSFITDRYKEVFFKPDAEMKIIVANYRYFIAGGPEQYMFNFIEAATERRIKIIPFSVKNIKNKNTEYEKYFAKARSSQLLYKDTKFNPKNIYGMIRATVWNFDAYKKMRKLIRKTQPDVVYILHEINHLSPSIILAAKKENVRVVHRISDFFMICPKSDMLLNNNVCEYCIHGKYKEAIKNRCVKKSIFATILRVIAMKIYKKTKVFDHVDKYVCTCEFTKNKLIEAGYNKNKITCINTFIDTSKIIPKYSHNKYFLILGRIAEQKGIIYAIKAMSILKKYNYKLYITGDLLEDEYCRKIRDYIEENKLNDKIVFTGFIRGKELKELVSNSTAVVMPAIWYENMPNSIIESFAYGKPVIASNIGSLSEMVINNENGFLFETKNYKDLSNKMLKYIKDNKLSEKHGKKAREICEEKYNTDAHMEKLIKIFKEK